MMGRVSATITPTRAPEPQIPTPPRRRRPGRLRRWFGIFLVLAGLGFLAFIAWQYFGTNVVSKQKQAEVRKVMAEDWGKGLDGDAIGLLRVERFGKDYEVPIVKGFSDDDFKRGVGWYEKGAMPGEIGNFVIAAHRVTNGEPFRDFLELRKDDDIIVETRTRIYTYELRDDGDALRVDFTQGWPLQPVPDPALRGEQPTEAVLTMLTCAELFRTRDRSVVFGDLVDIVDKSDPERQVELPRA